MATKPNAATPAVKSKAESYDIARSDETLDLAKDLAKFIKENKLSTQVQGREFVNVEGWQYAGSRLGIVPVVEHCINVSSEQELKYQAKVTLFDMRSQHTVGAGFAICSNKESGKKFYQEFAIASMAQTRAIGKAYRNILAWIIRAAGYEPTPAEEMEYTGNVPSMSGAPTATPAQPAGNVGGGSATASEPPVLRAESNSAAPVASTGAAPSGNVKELRQELTTLLGYVGSDLGTKDAQLEAHAAGVESYDRVRLAELVAHYRSLVTLPRASAEQKEEIIRLLNHPLITRQEKTKMLLNVNRINEERAKRAIEKLRGAIVAREGGATPTEAEQIGQVRANIGLLLKKHEGKLEIVDESALQAALANQHATLDELQAALRAGQIAASDAETDGTERELDAQSQAA